MLIFKENRAFLARKLKERGFHEEEKNFFVRRTKTDLIEKFYIQKSQGFNIFYLNYYIELLYDFSGVILLDGRVEMDSVNRDNLIFSDFDELEVFVAKVDKQLLIYFDSLNSFERLIELVEMIEPFKQIYKALIYIYWGKYDSARKQMLEISTINDSVRKVIGDKWFDEMIEERRLLQNALDDGEETCHMLINNLIDERLASFKHPEKLVGKAIT